MESTFVTLLFLMYLVLWESKRRRQKKSTGIDPRVLDKSTAPMQRFFMAMTNIITAAVVLNIIAHTSGIQYYSAFSRFPLLDGVLFDVIGFSIGLVGLGLCCVAQNTMKNSWRMGIDEHVKTDLVTGGVYRYIRNPTYVGVTFMLIGVWMIWPTWAFALIALAFYLLIEVQVRYEEEFLERTHGAEYRDYLKTTKRYIPGIY
jgi:protein-S-isoprenylcysteine O-methyltransferase Ste14